MYGRGVELDTGSRFPCDLVEKTKQNRKKYNGKHLIIQYLLGLSPCGSTVLIPGV